MSTKRNAAQGLDCIGNMTVRANSTGDAGDVAIDGSFTLNGPWLGPRVRGPRVVLADTGNHTISFSAGHRFEVSSAPALVRTITIDDTSPVPTPNQTIEILMPGPTATGQQYLIKRVGGVIIAEFWGNAAGDAGAWAEFEYVGGVWRLGANAGGGSAGGVLSGPGA